MKFENTRETSCDGWQFCSLDVDGKGRARCVKTTGCIRVRSAFVKWTWNVMLQKTARGIQNVHVAQKTRTCFSLQLTYFSCRCMQCLFFGLTLKEKLYGICLKSTNETQKYYVTLRITLNMYSEINDIWYWLSKLYDISIIHRIFK